MTSVLIDESRTPPASSIEELSNQLLHRCTVFPHPWTRKEHRLLVDTAMLATTTRLECLPTTQPHIPSHMHPHAPTPNGNHAQVFPKTFQVTTTLL